MVFLIVVRNCWNHIGGFRSFGYSTNRSIGVVNHPPLCTLSLIVHNPNPCSVLWASLICCIHSVAVCVPSGDTKKLGRQTFLHSRHIRYIGSYTRVCMGTSSWWSASRTLKQATNQSLKRNGLLKDNDIVRVLNMLIQRKVKATQRCVVHVHKATYSYYICTWCDVGVHYAITGLHVYTGTGTSCGSL